MYVAMAKTGKELVGLMSCLVRCLWPHRKLGSLSGSQSDSERSILQNLARIGYFTAFTLDSSGY